MSSATEVMEMVDLTLVGFFDVDTYVHYEPYGKAKFQP